MDKDSHEHCENCFKYSCSTTKSCKMMFCKFNCGARFHECKSHEHSLLCVKETVPCPSAVYGCPVKVKRAKLSQHLVVCPASIVFCTMQWNRYPLYSKSRLSWVPFFQPNPVLVKGHLDVELALRDQRVLQEMFKKRLRKGKAKVDILRTNSTSCDVQDGGDMDKNARHVDTRQIDMAVALSALEHKLKPLKFITEAPEGNFNALAQAIGMKMKQEDINLKDFESESEMLRPDSPRAAILCENINSTASCIKTNTDGDQLREQNSKSDTPNLTEVGDILRQCLETNKEEIKDNTTDNHLIDSTKKITVGNNRGCYCNHSLINEMQSISTQDQPITTDSKETSDLDLELPEPPKFKDIYLKEPLGLNVMLETLPKFQKQAPLYSIPCNQVFRRNEYGDHFKNVHSEIHGGLNGWVEHRCPLAQYGCTYVHHRLLPNNQCGRVTFNKELGSFGVKYCVLNTDDEPVSKECMHHITMDTDQDFFSNLPLEILETIAGMLDGFSLCQLSCTSKLLRQVCQRVLERNGLVSLEWEKRMYDNGTWSWKVRQKKWFFSAAFSPIKTWVHSSSPGMASHLEKCPFFERYVPTDKFCYQEVDNDVDGCNDMDYYEPSDKELDIERHWHELREIAGMY